jgi:hypothetical protein
MIKMTKGKEMYYKGLFLIAAIYDIVLGLGFLFFYKLIYNSLGIILPLNPSYLSLSAAFVLVIGIGYFMVYLNLRNRGLVWLGAFYKIAYVSIGVYYFIKNMLPHNIFSVFGIIDFIFLILFLEFLYNFKSR